MKTYQKILKGDTIWYIAKRKLEEEDKQTIKFIRGSKNTKAIKKVLAREIKNTMENEDLDLCDLEKEMIKEFNLMELDKWWRKELEEEDKRFFEEQGTTGKEMGELK